MLAVTLKTFQIQCMKSFLLTAHYLIKIKSSIASSKNFEIIQLLICHISQISHMLWHMEPLKLCYLSIIA